MDFLIWCKPQIICLLILGYVGLQYIRERDTLRNVTKRSNCNRIFDSFFIMTEVAVFFDGLTACTVNLLDIVPTYANILTHIYVGSR